MDTPTNADQIATLAGSTLSKGNPLDNPTTVATLKSLIPPEHRDFLWGGLERWMRPQFEAMQTLAAAVLAHDETPAVATLRAVALKTAAVQFRLYEAHHAMKEPADLTKSEVNAQMATMCEAALGTPVLMGFVSAEAFVCIQLLKGQAPAGVSWMDLMLAAALPFTMGGPDAVRPELIGGGWIREEGDKVFATDTAIADTAIPALDWPAKRA